MTATDTPQAGASSRVIHWDTINWQTIERQVLRLQIRSDEDDTEYE
ncbi:hypothetical protein [Escherichia coli]|nr:hypothetical protein [Escherichia coli]MDC6759048.1 hypothetical protein [Escherichia coli]